MLMDLPDLCEFHNAKITGVLHVGAHLAEEALTYAEMGITNVWWIEANPAVLPTIEHNLQPYPGQSVTQALVYSQDGMILDFNVTNYDGMSSSILEFGTHVNFSPDTVFVDKLKLPTKTLNTLVDELGCRGRFNLLNMDLQGAELHALKGATTFLDHIDYVMTEVNTDEVYKGCARLEELDDFLFNYGFDRFDTHMVGNQGWGDAFYIREKVK